MFAQVYTYQIISSSLFVVFLHVLASMFVHNHYDNTLLADPSSLWIMNPLLHCNTTAYIIFILIAFFDI